MKSHSSHSAAHETQVPEPRTDVDSVEELSQDRPLWDILDKASKREPDAFFARNVMRETRRLQASRSATSRSRLLALFTPARMAVAAATCACIMAAYHFWPTHDQLGTPTVTTQQDRPEPSTALTELVIQESLDAAAEDPSLFTHDELVVMIGF